MKGSDPQPAAEVVAAPLPSSVTSSLPGPSSSQLRFTFDNQVTIFGLLGLLLVAWLPGELWSGCQTRGAATRIVPTLLPGSDLIYSCSFVTVVYVVSLGFLYGNRIWSRSAIF